MSGERVIPQRRLIKFFQEGVGFQLLTHKKQSHDPVPDETGQVFALDSLMPDFELDWRNIASVIMELCDERHEVDGSGSCVVTLFACEKTYQRTPFDVLAFSA